MSDQNVELVRKGIEAFNAGGTEAMLAFVHPEIVSHPFPEWVEDTVYRGHDGIRRMFAMWDDFDDVVWEIREIRDVPPCILLLGEMSARIKNSGAPVRQQIAAVFSDFRDGMICESRGFISWEEALKALELSE